MRLRHAAGFAYLWTLLMVAMLGVGTVVASITYETSVQREQERELLRIGHEFREAIRRYQEFGQKEYPPTPEALLEDKRVPHVLRHLRKIYRDPFTGKQDWVWVKQNGRIVGVHSASGKVPIKQAGFDADDAGLAGKGKISEWVFVYPINLVVGGQVNADGSGALGVPPITGVPQPVPAPQPGAVPAGGGSPMTGGK